MSKRITLVCIMGVLLILTACGGPDISDKKVKKEYFTGGQLKSEFIMDDDSGKNGILKRYGYNGKVTSTVQINNGVKNGMETLYDPEGRALRKVPYINGRIHGNAKEFYPNGDVFRSWMYDKGDKEGMAYSYNKNGTVHSKLLFKNDKAVR